MGVWSESGSEAEILTVREEPACTVWSSMAVMIGGLSSAAVIVRVNSSVAVKPPEMVVMVILVSCGVTLRSGPKRRSAVPSPVEVSLA